MAVRVVTDPRPPSLTYDLLGTPEGVKEEMQVSHSEQWVRGERAWRLSYLVVSKLQQRQGFI